MTPTPPLMPTRYRAALPKAQARPNSSVRGSRRRAGLTPRHKRPTPPAGRPASGSRRPRSRPHPASRTR
eukprot:8179541-Lingulodinium_polyedra.AAC.1